MRQAVIAQVIAKGAFGQLPVGIDRTGDTKVRFAIYGQPRAARDHADAMPAQGACKGEFGQAFGQWHHGRHAHRRRAADKDIHSQGLAAADGLRVVYADPAMNLIVQADFLIWPVTPARKLHAVHAQVRSAQAGAFRVFGINLRQRDEGAPVVGPRSQLRQLIDRRLLREHGSGTDAARQHVAQRGH
jgi:hypothetical protein